MLVNPEQKIVIIGIINSHIHLLIHYYFIDIDFKASKYISSR